MINAYREPAGKAYVKVHLGAGASPGLKVCVYPYQGLRLKLQLLRLTHSTPGVNLYTDPAWERVAEWLPDLWDQPQPAEFALNKRLGRYYAVRVERLGSFRPTPIDDGFGDTRIVISSTYY